jgi:hypothetical protein
MIKSQKNQFYDISTVLFDQNSTYLNFQTQLLN